jgi:hypothetical protein
MFNDAEIVCRDLTADFAASSVCSLSHRERGGVRGHSLSMAGNPLTPTLSPNGERERAEFAASVIRPRTHGFESLVEGGAT